MPHHPHPHPRLPIALSLILGLALSLHSAAQFPFKIASDTPRSGLSNFSDLNAKPAGSNGFVRRKGEQFVTDSGPIRFWGINLCFGANFPEKADADRLAAHLSSLAINAVRIHHQETQYAPTGLYHKDSKKLDPAQVGKLDYLLAQLHAHGIYANLNLHVGRNVARELGLPPIGSGHSATGDKLLLHFFPPVQNAFWQYCRDYLGHMNPHRKLRRADDPAIAMIEILNENRFHKHGSKFLLNAPQPYRSEIKKQWNTWLEKTYQSDDALHKAWAETTTPPPGNTLLTSPSSPLSKGWILQDQGGKFPVTLSSPEAGTLRLSPQVQANTSWHQQLSFGNLKITKGTLYTLSFEARSAAPRPLLFSLASLENGWASLGLSEQITLSSEWKKTTLRFTATQSSQVAKLAFDLGGQLPHLDLRALSLHPGAAWTTIPSGQSLSAGNIDLPSPQSTPAAHTTFVRFMAHLEATFYQKTRSLLQELGVRVPITTTQINYQGASMTAELADYADIHSYWHHPLFPGKSWDRDHWTIGHDPLEARPYANQWPRNNPLIRSSWRIHGMPFTYSEWNVGEPSFPSAGAVPIMALLGSLQEWSGIFFFDYDSSSLALDREEISTYFSFNSQAAKLALLGPFGALYRSGELAALHEKMSSPPDFHLGSGIHAFTKRIGIDPSLPNPPEQNPPTEAELLKTQPPHLRTPDKTATWDARNPDKAILTINLPRTRALWGKIGGQKISLGNWHFQVGTLPQNYGVIIAQSRDGLPLESSKSILITSVSHARNPQFPWKDQAQSQGGSNWGTSPTQVWNAPFALTIPDSQISKRPTLLDPRNRKSPLTLPPLPKNTPTLINFPASTQTLWLQLSP